MQIRETIRLDGTPFPAPLPAPAADLIAAFAEHGYTFADMGNSRSIMLNEPYLPERLARVRELVASSDSNLKVEHSVWPVFDETDYANAPLWVLRFPDVWIDGIDFTRTCNVCGQKTTVVDFNVKVSAVRSKGPILTVNGQFEIVRSGMLDVIKSSLRGARFYPFDEEGKYSYFSAEESLGEMICRESECIDHRGRCSHCGRSVFSVFFGPLRYSRNEWLGEDIVYGEFHDGNLFTPRAFDVVSGVEPRVTKDGVAFLE